MTTADSDMVEGGYVFTAPGTEATAGSAWSQIWCLNSSGEAQLELIDASMGLGDLHDGQWKVPARSTLVSCSTSILQD